MIRWPIVLLTARRVQPKWAFLYWVTWLGMAGGALILWGS